MSEQNKTNGGASTLGLVVLGIVFTVAMLGVVLDTMSMSGAAGQIAAAGLQRHDARHLSYLVLRAQVAGEDETIRAEATRTIERFDRTRSEVLADPPASATPAQLDAYRERTGELIQRAQLLASSDTIQSSDAFQKLVSETKLSVDDVVSSYEDDVEAQGNRHVLFLLMAFGSYALVLYRVYKSASGSIGRLREQQMRTELEVESLFAASPAIMCVANFDYEFVKLNRATKQILGYEPEEMEGRPFFDFLHPDDQKITAEAADQLADGNELTQFRNRYIAKDGTSRTLEWRSISRTDVERMYAIAVDVTPMQELFETLKLNKDELERSNEALDDFAYIASHDLRAPLRDIDNLSAWIVQDVGDDLPEKSREHLEKIRGRIVRMDRLLTDLLTYSRAGRAKIDPVEVDDFAELCGGAVELANVPDTFKVDFDLEVEGVVTARTPLMQLLTNLVSNAVKHHDKELGRIQIRARTSQNRLIVEVEDDGPGIPKRYHDKVFELFQTLSRNHESTGLGLALCRKFAHQLGGTITVESNEGEGTTFRVDLPQKIEVIATSTEDQVDVV